MKQRVDVLLFERGLCESRERARSSVMSGLVYVDGQKAEKPGQSVSDDCLLELRGDPVGYVSRGGLKLAKALEVFSLSVKGLCCLDAGASTGGFTDCMLKQGAAKVWAVDVGYGQLAWRLRNDARVVVMERTNVRRLTPKDLGEPAEFCTADLSFISLRLVLPALHGLLLPGAAAVMLVKPQFEAGREHVGKNGVVREPAIHRDVLTRFREDAAAAGFSLQGLDFSPIRGPKGNIEFLGLLRVSAEPPAVSEERIAEVTELAHSHMQSRREDAD